ncbi:MAG: sigma-70 family RNA polymerase sigma factor [Pseudohongiellaceae bacterium]
MTTAPRATVYSRYRVHNHNYLDPLRLYYKEIGYISLLTADEEQALARRVRAGDAEARARMIVCNLRLVVKIALRYANHRMELMDLVEEGNLGLIRAVERFDPEKGFRFSTYGTWWIRQSIERLAMTQDRTVRVPLHTMKELKQCLSIETNIINQKGEVPTWQERIAATGKSVTRLHTLLGLDGGRQFSLDTTTMSNQEWEEIPLLEALAGDESFEPVNILNGRQIQDWLKEWIDELSPRQQEIINRRFGFRGFQPDTLDNIATAMGLTRERVRQIQINALKELRAMIGRDGVEREALSKVPTSLHA